MAGVASVGALMLLTALAGIAQTQSTFACPASLDHGAHALMNASVLNGTPGKEEYDLTPDDETRLRGRVALSWNLKDYRDMNLFVRCHYRGTSAVINANLPAHLTTCSVTLQLNKRQDIIGESRMSCH
jgi:hypothetical protein